jgi:hypothetical protein
VLEQEGALALNLVDDLWGSTIVSAWRTWERAVVRLRELTATPRTYESFERLAVRLEAYPTRRDQRAA